MAVLGTLAVPADLHEIIFKDEFHLHLTTNGVGRGLLPLSNTEPDRRLVLLRLMYAAPPPFSNSAGLFIFFALIAHPEVVDEGADGTLLLGVDRKPALFEGKESSAPCLHVSRDPSV